ncbi:phosphoribosylglycinamide formyltransferase [Algihabitans albus]|uniref:phosphoribosylglycinamide formyltransferase n=1 Tax=Algihabitans albus TaxID=2164067 RepID=UPI000E5D115E|nr:phosphoribosylglycinamide formyltransferase [Algihabitans albus]
MTRKRVGVLISGRGSNLQALLDAAAQPDCPFEIVLVLSNTAKVQGLERASAVGVATAVVDHRTFPDREAFEKAMTEALEAAQVELVCQAGFMRVVTPWFVTHWHDRLLNIHPSLLPAFPGLDTHGRALAAGVKLHGCSVHLVRETVDQGPILGQAAVPVLPDDDPESLAARVLEAEHRLYPTCLALYATGRIEVSGETARVESACGPGRLLINPTPEASGA